MAEPKVGDRKVINGVEYRWNGREGVPVGPASPAPSRPAQMPTQIPLGAAPPSVRGEIARGEIAAAQAPYAGGIAAADATKATADAAKAQHDAEQAVQGAPLPEGLFTSLKTSADTLKSFDAQLSRFKPEYAGLPVLGGVENAIQRRVHGFGSKGQANWWAAMSAADAAIRKDLYGSSLTANEKAAWEATTISPGMAPEEVRSNLLRRRLVLQTALARAAAGARAGGYRPAQIDALTRDVAPLLAPEAIARGEEQFQAMTDEGAPSNPYPDAPVAQTPRVAPGGPDSNALSGRAAGPGWATPEQEAQVMAYATGADFTPEGYADLLDGMAKANGYGGLGAGRQTVMDAAAAALAREAAGQSRWNTSRGVQYLGGEPVRVQPDEQDGVTMLPSSAKPGESMPWGEVGVNAGQALPKSTLALAEGVGSAVIHAPETVKALGSLAAGALNKLDPTGVVTFDEGTIDALGRFYADRYGSVEGFKAAVADDPAGVLADASTLLTGMGGAATKLGAVGKIAGLEKAGQAASALGRAVDPLAAASRIPGGVGAAVRGLSQVPGPVGDAAKATQRVGAAARDLPGLAARYILGSTTGAGPEAIGRAAAVGAEQGLGPATARSTNFLNHLRGRAPVEDVVTQAEQAMADMQATASQAYRDGMVDVTKDKTILDFAPIDRTLVDLYGQAYHNGKVKNPAAAKIWAQGKAIVDEWANGDPRVDHTPQGMDALKQRIGALIDDSETAGDRAAASVAKSLYHEVRKAVADQVPGYAQTMRQYEDAQRALGELRSTFATGSKAATDTKLRKLQSIMRNNANTNYGRRAALGEQLDSTAAGAGMLDALAGQAGSSLTPRGLQSLAGGSAGLAGLGGLLTGSLHNMPAVLDPRLLAVMPLTSPRLMSEAAYTGGRLYGGGKSALDSLMAKYREHPYPVLAAGMYGSRQDEGPTMQDLQAKYAADQAAQSIYLPNPGEEDGTDPLPLGALNLGTGDLPPARR